MYNNIYTCKYVSEFEKRGNLEQKIILHHKILLNKGFSKVVKMDILGASYGR